MLSPTLTLKDREARLSTPVSRRSEALLARLAAHRYLGAGVLYALVALFADWPIWPGDPWRVPTQLSGDIAQTVWFLRYTPWAILHGQNLFATNIINYPTGVDLSQNTGIPLLGLLTAPLTLAVNAVASMNLLRFLAFTLSALAMFYVADKWTGYRPAAFVAGLLYGFSPYMVTQGSIHLDLMFVPMPPIILSLLYEIFVTQAATSRRKGLQLGIAMSLQFFISAEVLATTILIGAIGVVFVALYRWRAIGTRARYAFTSLLWGALVLVPLLVYPLFVLFTNGSRYSGPAQGYNSVYNADLLGPIVPTNAQALAPTHLASTASAYVGAQLQENGSYLSIPLLLLALYFLVRYRRSRPMILLGLIGLSAFVLSLGAHLIIDNKTVLPGLKLPFGHLEHVPLIESVLPVRFSLYVMVMVAMIVAIGIASVRADHERRLDLGEPGTMRWATSRWPTSRPAVALGVVLACCAACLIPRWPYKSLPLKTNWAESPQGLAIIPSGDTVLTYPYATAFADQPMLWQALSGMRFKLFGSYALVRNPLGMATTFPQILQPSVVEATLINSVTPTPDPDLPADVLTSASIAASHVVVVGHRHVARIDQAGEVTGVVSSVDPLYHRFVVNVTNYLPIVVTDEHTTYAPASRSAIGVVPGDHVIVTGVLGPGTLNHALVVQLQRFVANNGVDDVVIDMGLRDSGEIAIWMREAFGSPTRAGAGGEIWVGLQHHHQSAATS